jgi:DNA-binding response OmpR family regulator
VDGLAICQAIRNEASADTESLARHSCLRIAKIQRAGEAAGVTEWMVKPFTSSYVRTKVRAWTTCAQPAAGSRAPIPDDEESRLSVLNSLSILDTGPNPV